MASDAGIHHLMWLSGDNCALEGHSLIHFDIRSIRGSIPRRGISCRFLTFCLPLCSCCSEKFHPWRLRGIGRATAGLPGRLLPVRSCISREWLESTLKTPHSKKCQQDPIGARVRKSYLLFLPFLFAHHFPIQAFQPDFQTSGTTSQKSFPRKIFQNLSERVEAGKRFQLRLWCQPNAPGSLYHTTRHAALWLRRGDSLESACRWVRRGMCCLLGRGNWCGRREGEA